MEKGKKRSNLMVFILIALASALSVFSIQTFLYNRSLEGELKSINEKLVVLHLISTCKDTSNFQKEVLSLQFKEDFYLNQLNNSITIILGSIGFVLALGGFLSYRNIDESLSNIKENSDETSALSKALSDSIEKVKSEIEINSTQIKALEVEMDKKLKKLFSDFLVQELLELHQRYSNKTGLNKVASKTDLLDLIFLTYKALKIEDLQNHGVVNPKDFTDGAVIKTDLSIHWKILLGNDSISKFEYKDIFDSFEVSALENLMESGTFVSVFFTKLKTNYENLKQILKK